MKNKNKTCYIIGSGASIRKNQWDIPAQSLPVWSLFKDKHVITLNWGYKFIDPLIEIYVDHRFYATEYNQLNKLNLVIGKDDAYYVREKAKYQHLLNNNLFLLKNAVGANRKYWSKDSWTKGFYSGQLTGLFAISIALQLGYDKIFLLGYDGHTTNGYTHFYQDDNVTGHLIWEGQKQTGVGKDDRGNFKTGTYNKDLNSWFEPLSVESHKIINVNSESKITVFPKISYSELIEHIQSDVSIDKRYEQERIKNMIRDNYDK
ncbi:MAG: hypothetical protein ACTSWD_09515 [Candidatus Heimdallarchaeota archaeon]